MKTKRIELNPTPEEYARLSAAAKAVGLPLALYVKSKALADPATSHPVAIRSEPVAAPAAAAEEREEYVPEPEPVLEDPRLEEFNKLEEKIDMWSRQIVFAQDQITKGVDKDPGSPASVERSKAALAAFIARREALLAEGVKPKSA